MKNHSQSAKKILSFVIILLFGLGLVSAVLADTKPTDNKEPQLVSLKNPLGTGTAGYDPSNVQNIIARISNSLVAYVGAVAFLFLIYGGYTWIFSRGNEEKVKKGKDIIIWTLVGVAVVFCAYVILTAVFSALNTGKV